MRSQALLLHSSTDSDHYTGTVTSVWLETRIELHQFLLGSFLTICWSRRVWCPDLVTKFTPLALWQVGGEPNKTEFPSTYGV